MHDNILCGNCFLTEINDKDLSYILEPGNISSAAAVTLYDANSAKAVFAMKNYKEHRIYDFYAEKLADKIKSHGMKPDIIAPVPMSRKSRKKRGFDNISFLAHKLGDILKLEVMADILHRKDSSVTQHLLNEQDRFTNAEDSYYADDLELSGLNILLVDDVVTTGATANICAARLLERGAHKVYLAVVAATLEADSHI